MEEHHDDPGRGGLLRLDWREAFLTRL